MKAKTSLLLLTLATTLGLTGPVAAAHLKAPDDLVCKREFDNSVNSKWENRKGASYYAVEVMAEYDVSNNGEMDRTHEFHFGSKDPELYLAPGDLMGSFVDDYDSEVVGEMPMAATIRVKAIHLGRGWDNAMNQTNEAYNAVDGQARNADFSECKVTFGSAAPCRGFCR